MTFQEIIALLPKPYYQDDAVVIYHADCRAILPLIPDKSIDLVLTDPPYGIDKADWDGDFILPEIIPADVMGLMPGVWNLLNCPKSIAGLNYRWQLVAHLVNGMTNGKIGFGNYIPCLVFARDGVNVFRKESDCKDFVVGIEVKPEHPCPKPERPMAWFTDRLSLPDNVILDPFLGSGTTAYCAKKLGRKCIGIEIEEKYCEIAAKRCMQSVMSLEIPQSPGTSFISISPPLWRLLAESQLAYFGSFPNLRSKLL